MVGQQPADFRHGLVVTVAPELGLDPELDGIEAELGEPFGLGFDQRRRPDVGQRPDRARGPSASASRLAARCGSPEPSTRLPSRTMASNSSASVSVAATRS